MLVGNRGVDVASSLAERWDDLFAALREQVLKVPPVVCKHGRRQSLTRMRLSVGAEAAGGATHLVCVATLQRSATAVAAAAGAGAGGQGARTGPRTGHGAHPLQSGAERRGRPTGDAHPMVAGRSGVAAAREGAPPELAGAGGTTDTDDG